MRRPESIVSMRERPGGYRRPEEETPWRKVGGGIIVVAEDK